MSAAIGGAASVIQQTNSTPGANGFAELSSNEFLQIILAELSNQDPLAPNDTAAILEQLSSIRNIESQVQLEDKLDTLVTQNAIAAGSQMIGSYVAGLDKNNDRVEGLVDSLSVQDGKPVLKLASGKEIAAERVTEVADLSDLNGQQVQRLLMDLQVLDSSKLVGMEVAGEVRDPSSGGVVNRSGTVSGVELIDGSIVLQLEGGQKLPLVNVLSFGEVTPTPSADSRDVIGGFVRDYAGDESR